MKKGITAALLTVCLLLTGCASLLEREYSTAEPHSSKFWESETAGTLRAENHQDVVNDLLLLITEHRETATLKVYNFDEELAVTEMLEKASMEVQQETPLGAYAVLYITSQTKVQRGFHEVQLQIGYRRTAEQIGRIINATTPEAIYTLLAATLDAGRTELAVRVGYWSEDAPARLGMAIRQLRQDRGLQDTPPWTVNYYPETGAAVLVEVLLDEVPEEDPFDALLGPEGAEPEIGPEDAPPEDGTEAPPDTDPEEGPPEEEPEDSAEPGEEIGEPSDEAAETGAAGEEPETEQDADQLPENPVR